MDDSIQIFVTKDIDVDYTVTLEDLEAVSGSVETDEPLGKIHDFIMNDPDWMKSSIRTAKKLYGATKYRNTNFKFHEEHLLSIQLRIISRL